MKRPACLISVCLLIFLLLFYHVRPPVLLSEEQCPEGPVRVRGRLYDRYEKDGSMYLILKDAEILDTSMDLSSRPCETDDRRRNLEGRLHTEEERNLKGRLHTGEGRRYGVKVKLSAVADRAAPPVIDSLVEARGRVFIFPTDRNPGNFDMAMYEKVHGRDFELCEADITGTYGRGSPLREALCAFRERLASVADAIYEEDEAQVVKAMVLGDRHGLGEDIKGLYRRAGMSHVLCISGLHVSIIGLGLLKLFDRIKMEKRISYALTVLILLLYGGLTGAGISTVRALIMIGLVILARITHRTPDVLSSMSFACVMVLAFRPLYIFDAGFVLSFCAVTGIGFLGPPLSHLIPGGGGRAAPLVSALSVNIFMLPVTMYYFYQIPVLSFFINLIIVPAVGIVIISSALPLIAGSVCLAPAYFISTPSSLMLKGFKAVAGVNDSIPFSLTTTGRPDTLRMMLYYLLLWILCILSERLRDDPVRYRRAGSLILILLIPLMAFRWERGLTVTMIDVGQGDCHLIEAGGETLMIDCGSSDIKHAAEYRVMPYLLYRGYGSIDYALLTHTDADHMNGYEEMLDKGPKEGIRIGALIMGESGPRAEDRQRLAEKAARAGTKVYTIKSGDMFNVGDVTVRCLAPDNEASYGDTNEASVCLDITFGDFRALYTGDVEGEGEKILMEKIDNTRYTMLKCAHHGSSNSTPEELLDSIRPSYCIISAGVDNRYGHPHKELMERLENAGCITYVTNKSGAVVLHTDGNNLRISEYLGKGEGTS